MIILFYDHLDYKLVRIWIFRHTSYDLSVVVMLSCASRPYIRSSLRWRLDSPIPPLLHSSSVVEEGSLVWLPVVRRPLDVRHSIMLSWAMTDISSGISGVCIPCLKTFSMSVMKSSGATRRFSLFPASRVTLSLIAELSRSFIRLT